MSIRRSSVVSTARVGWRAVDHCTRQRTGVDVSAAGPREERSHDGELDYRDADYEVTVVARAVKPLSYGVAFNTRTREC